MNVCFVSTTGKIWFSRSVVDQIYVHVQTNDPEFMTGYKWVTMNASELLACTQDIYAFNLIETETTNLKLLCMYGNPYISQKWGDEIYAYDDDLLELALNLMLIADKRDVMKVLLDKHKLWKACNPGDLKPRIVWKWSRDPSTMPCMNIIVPSKLEKSVT